MNRKTNYRLFAGPCLIAAFLFVTAKLASAGSADLKITVTVTPASPQIGDLIHYKCVVTNLGPDTPSSLHGDAGPDNQDGGCVPGNPSVSCDKYTSFDASSPSQPFFTDSTQFKYFHILLCTDATCNTTGAQVSTITPTQTGVFNIYYKATANGTANRFIGVHSDDQSVTDPAPSNNDMFAPVVIGGSGGGGPPTLPPTGFTVNGSTSVSSNVADTVLRFAATQTGSVAGLSVRIQATTTPNTEASWTDLNNSRGGRMTYDKGHTQFVLNSTDYPLQNGVYFRALTSAHNYKDSISNIVPPTNQAGFNLATNKPHLPPTRLYVESNNSYSDLYFKATVASPQSGETMRIQSSSNPTDESSWSDIPNGNAGHMTPSVRPAEFILPVNNYPATSGVFFRAVGSLSGSTDSISQPVGSYDLVSDVPPKVTMTMPSPVLPGGGDGTSADKPILLQAGFFSFGATIQSGQPLKFVALGIDGTLLQSFENGETSVSVVTANVVGDHTLECLAVDKLGGTKRLDAGVLYIRIVPENSTGQSNRAESASVSTASTGRTFHVVRDNGVWTDPTTWDQNDKPGPDDFVVIGSSTVRFGLDGDAKSISINGGHLVGTATLNVYGQATIFGGSIDGEMTLLIKPGAVLELLNQQDIQFNPDSSGFRGNIINEGTCNVHGAAGIIGTQQFVNLGTLNWQRPITPPVGADTDPLKLVRGIYGTSVQNSGVVSGSVGILLTSDGAGLLTSDGAGILTNNGGTLVAPNGGAIVSHDGGTIIGDEGNGLLTSDGAGLLSEHGAGVISMDGAGIVSEHGAGLHAAQNATRTDAPAAATASNPFTQTGGVLDLSHCLVLGPATINGGSVIGNGIIAGNVTNNAYISPGHSVGGITILGSYTQGANGTLIIENGGATPDKYDRFQVNGPASLNGKLDVRDVNGYTPAATDVFNPIGFQSVSGSFSSVSSNATVTVSSSGVLISVDPAKPAPKPAQPLNISTRMQVLAGDNTLIAGFIVTGPNGSTKKVLIRGLGPSLAQFGVPGTMPDPLLELHKPDNSVVTNDNWQQGDTSQIPNGFAPSDPRESVIVATLSPGNYTAVLKGAHGETGVGIAEVYDLDSSSTAQLANISTRGFVNTGDNVMIGGFIVSGSEPSKVLVRAIGPSLTAFGVQGALPATTLEVHDVNGNVISNQGWRNTQETEIKATNIQPSNDNEAAILATLVPGSYTAVVRGKNNTTGVGLVEAYNLQ